jgi:hypothetical protein
VSDLLYYAFKDTALLPSTSIVDSKSPRSASTMLADLKSVEFSYEELAEATNDFNLSYKIGQGGFASGFIYFIFDKKGFYVVMSSWMVDGIPSSLFEFPLACICFLCGTCEVY